MNDDNLTAAALQCSLCTTADALGQFSEKLTPLLIQQPAYAAAMENVSQQLAVCTAKLMPQTQSFAQLLTPALMRMSQETAEIWKQVDTSRLTSQINVAVHRFSDVLQTPHEADELVPIGMAEAILKDAQPLLVDDAAAVVEHKIEAAKKPENKITWHDILEIITFIFLILNFVKDMLPDKHDQLMESEIVAIRENQEKQIQLMDDQYQSFDDFRDDFAVFSEKLQQAEDFVDSAADDVDADFLKDNTDP